MKLTLFLLFTFVGFMNGNRSFTLNGERFRIARLDSGKNQDAKNTRIFYFNPTTSPPVINTPISRNFFNNQFQADEIRTTSAPRVENSYFDNRHQTNLKSFNQNTPDFSSNFRNPHNYANKRYENHIESTPNQATRTNFDDSSSRTFAPYHNNNQQPHYGRYGVSTEPPQAYKYVTPTTDAPVNQIQSPKDADTKNSVEPYSFSYEVPDEFGNSHSRQESTDSTGAVSGSYTIQTADGLYRKVYYVADEFGYRASIQSNEPGVANKDPAGVAISHQETPQHINNDYENTKGYNNHYART